MRDHNFLVDLRRLTDQIEKTYGHVAKVRVRVDGFDYVAPDAISEAAD